MRSVLAIVLGYLIGSIPFGYLIVRLRFGADIRETGSGGTGATNVSRRAGKAAGLITLLLDAAKGAAAVIVAMLLAGSAFRNLNTDWFVGAAGVAALLGHIFPVWLNFRGGKGVATGVGVMAVLAPVETAIAAGAFLITFSLARYVSLASMAAAISLPFAVLIYGSIVKNTLDEVVLMTSVAGAILIVWAHRANISRLIAGTESKFR